MIKKLLTKIHIWWFTRSDGEKVFYYTNSPLQIFLLFFPALWIENNGDIIEQWYQANPSLFDSLAIPALLGWVFFMFLARWALGWILAITYKEHDLRLPWNYDKRLSYFQEESED